MLVGKRPRSAGASAAATATAATVAASPGPQRKQQRTPPRTDPSSSVQFSSLTPSEQLQRYSLLAERFHAANRVGQRQQDTIREQVEQLRHLRVQLQQLKSANHGLSEQLRSQQSSNCAAADKACLAATAAGLPDLPRLLYCRCLARRMLHGMSRVSHWEAPATCSCPSAGMWSDVYVHKHCLGSWRLACLQLQ